MNNELTITEGSITTPQGFKASGVHCFIKQTGPDLALIASDTPCSVAAMFTTNRVPASCIIIDREKAETGRGQAIVINSGNANACTGQQGLADSREMAALAAAELHIDPALVYVASTGVIGHHLPMQLIRDAMPQAGAALSYDGGMDALRAIMTTDTRPKHLVVSFELDGKSCSIGAIAKGSGMINPNMATMICVMTSDVAIEQPLLLAALREAVSVSFNMLTIDGEMSTNDCIFLFANGQAKNKKITAANSDYQIFKNALNALAIAMTKKIARDGEGATKLVTVTVDQAQSHAEAEKAAKAIANSALVKTAIFGQDPNWGRVVQAIGASGVQVDADHFHIQFAGITVAENGSAIAYDQDKMRAAQQQEEIRIYAGLGAGQESATVFTCDLTHDYITINADYHT
ncbi:MAG TPA: bifunctional glutamate N-acetyltransferase/amino-acid acetyltransferase ArgJ [bacterium]|nr:bifunctional glutamate N-acetyltransferase/amino-acid acetyltransferase ArgJ [bacterium]HPN45716.1 bifunctional glutamate N-acetyltransferase/amino-acid acetyltransferase ArgJ [bacterium]